MAYTVKKLAQVSGVSVRTLHFYDEIGLLPPAYVGDNGYRYYQEEQLLMLQQILFFRELGFELKEIQKILGQPEFDKLHALASHKDALQHKQRRMQELISTIDKTIKQINGERIMSIKEMYAGFTPEGQAERESFLVNRYGEYAKKWVEESKENTKNWSHEQWENFSEEWNDICAHLAALLAKNTRVGSPEVQAIVEKHYLMIKKFWTPNHESYIGLGLGYLEFDWKKAFEEYDSQHPKLARYLADAIKVFADHKLK